MLEDRILYVDAEAIVIDKPAGLPVDTPRAGGDSVALRADELKLGFQREPVAMHRLDQDTSGCLLLARNPKARAKFQQAFESGRVEKTYLAVAHGTPSQIAANTIMSVARPTPQGNAFLGERRSGRSASDIR